MRFPLTCALALVVSACSSQPGDLTTSSDALGGVSSLATELGSADLSLNGTTLRVTSWTYVVSLKFTASVIAPDGSTESFPCVLGSGDGGAAGAELQCGDAWGPASFVIAPSGAGATIANGSRGKLASLHLQGDTPAPLAVVAAHGLDVFTVANRVVDAVAEAGSFAVPGEEGTVAVDAWSLFDQELSVAATLHGPNGDAATVRCYDSAETPDVWANPGSRQSGLASVSALADRIQALVRWQFANCHRSH